jgi:hypothetical protein
MAKWIVQGDAAGNGFEVTADACEPVSGCLVFSNDPVSNDDDVDIVGCIAPGSWVICAEENYLSCFLPFTAEEGPSVS